MQNESFSGQWLIRGSQIKLFQCVQDRNFICETRRFLSHPKEKILIDFNLNKFYDPIFVRLDFRLIRI